MFTRIATRSRADIFHRVLKRSNARQHNVLPKIHSSSDVVTRLYRERALPRAIFVERGKIPLAFIKHVGLINETFMETRAARKQRESTPLFWIIGEKQAR